MIQEILRKVKPEMSITIEHLAERLKSVRTSGAQTGLVEDIKVDYYGSKQPLKSLAQITTPESNLILIQPFDRLSLGDIRLAIINSSLGLNPSDDGQSLRIVVPALTEERRNELVKFVKSIAEEARITLRTSREEAWREIQKLHKDKKIADDDRNWGREELDKIIADYNAQVSRLIEERQQALTKF